jgi:phosphate transport system permease protein
VSATPSPRRRRSADDRLFRAGTGFFALLVVLLVGAIAFVLWTSSRLSITKFGFSFWKTSTWDPVSGEFGAYPFIWGTLYSSFLAMLLSTPIALGIAIYISELSPRRLRTPLSFLTELLAAVPSIVYGLWGVFVLVPAVRKLQTMLPGWLRKTPFFSGPPLGIGMLSAALILAVMVVPFTSSIAREVLKAVPPTQREAAYALGETMAVTMVIGNAPRAVLSLFAPQYTMAAVIANEFTEATDDLYLSALVEIGLVLFAITLLVNIASRFLIWRVGRDVQPEASKASPAAAPAEQKAAA